MSTFNSEDHPRGHVNNRGSFIEKANTEPESALRPVGVGLTFPEGWDGSEPLHPATDWMDDRMQGGEIVAHPDPINARCDYAEVNEDGIAYGYEITPALIGEIVVGLQEIDESDDEYADRVNAVDSWTMEQVEQFFRNEYGVVDTLQSGDYGHLALEFFVPFGPEGAAGTSVESMGDRVENETLLLTARNDWEYGGRMQSRLAEALGYRAETTADTHGTFGTIWVRDEELVSS